MLGVLKLRALRLPAGVLTRPQVASYFWRPRSLTFVLPQWPKMPQFYAVREGRKRGIYDTWDECKSQVDGHKGAQFKKFRSRQEAEDFIAVGSSKPPALVVAGVAPVRVVKKAVRRLTSAAVPTTSKPAISVFTDGACSSNGRKGAKAGYGVFWGDGHEDNHSAPLISGPQTNNRAEYTAIIHALETAKKRDLKAIRVCTDSNLLIRSMTEWLPKWKRNGWQSSFKQPVKNADLLKQIDALCQQLRVEFEHVRGHSGIHGNEMADQLAREGAAKNI